MSDLSLSQGGNRWLVALGNVQSQDRVPWSPPEDANLAVLCARATDVLTQSSCDGRLSGALADARKSHVEMARSKLAKLFSEASVDGRLSAAINELQTSQHAIVDSIESPLEVADRDKARSDLARVLADASADGRLYAALVEAQASVSEAPELYQELEEEEEEEKEEEGEEAEAEMMEDIEQIRLHAFGMLSRAAHDGSLFDALSEVHQQQRDSGRAKDAGRLEDLRLKTRQILSQATDDGSLSTALAEVIKPKVDIQSIRVRTRELLTNAVDDGSLFKALVEVRGPAAQVFVSQDVEQARTSLAQLLAESSADGRLFAALSEVHTTEQDISPDEDVEDIDDDSSSWIPSEHVVDKPRCGTPNVDSLRSTLSGLLSQAATDGRLFAALSEVQAQKTTTYMANEVLVQSSQEKFVPEPVSSQEEDIENIRLRTLDIFKKATEDGSLANILDEVKAQAKHSPDKTEAAQSWRGACVLQSEDCAHRVRDALRQGKSSPNEIEAAKLKLRRAMLDAMSDGTFHDALMETRSRVRTPTLTDAPSPEIVAEISSVAPHPPPAKRRTGMSRPCSSATTLRKAPQVAEEVSIVPAMKARLPENVGPSLPVGPAGRAFRRRHHTKNVSEAMPAVCLDIGDLAEDTDGRDSSLARGYDVLGAQVFSISDRPESVPRPPSCPSGNLNRCGRPIRSRSRGSNSATIAVPPHALDSPAVSAMELDLGDSAKPVHEMGFYQPTVPCTAVQKFRSSSVGGARFGKKMALESLPAIKSKTIGRRPAHSVSACRAQDSLAWTLGVSRRNLDSIGAVF